MLPPENPMGFFLGFPTGMREIEDFFVFPFGGIRNPKWGHPKWKTQKYFLQTGCPGESKNRKFQLLFLLFT
jgi:hypothetical protein